MRSTFFTALLFLALPLPALAATLSIAPANESFAAGDTVTVSILVSSADQALNAISGTLSFPPDLLHVVSLSKAGSIISLWVQEPSYSNDSGTVQFEGVVPNPGFSGTSGRVLSVTFIAEVPGAAHLSLDNGQVLANDGSGTDILSGSNPATISISKAVVANPVPASSIESASAPSAPHITSSSHPDQTLWYSRNHAVFDWTNDQSTTRVYLGYDTKPDGKPSILYAQPISHKELDLADGVSYFHVQEKNAGGFGPVSTYKVQIDTQPPHDLSISFPNGTTTNESAIAVRLAASDDGSGVDRYELAVDGKTSVVPAAEAEHDTLVPASGGTHTLTVVAFDKAGNRLEGRADFTSLAPAIAASEQKTTIDRSGWFVAAALLVVAFLSFWFLFLNPHHRRRMTLPADAAEDIRRTVHAEFLELREALTEEIARLERVRSRRDLSAAETRIFKRFKLLLQRSESSIEAELERVSGS